MSERTVCDFQRGASMTNVTFKTLHYSEPSQLHSLLHHHTPARALTSSNTNMLIVPFTHTILDAHSFSVTSPKIWNSLPLALCSCNCPDTFHRQSKVKKSKERQFVQCFVMNLISKALRYGFIARRSHSFTCHPHEPYLSLLRKHSRDGTTTTEVEDI